MHHYTKVGFAEEFIAKFVYTMLWCSVVENGFNIQFYTGAHDCISSKQQNNDMFSTHYTNARGKNTKRLIQKNITHYV